jgi:hypothetical protein
MEVDMAVKDSKEVLDTQELATEEELEEWEEVDMEVWEVLDTQ